LFLGGAHIGAGALPVLNLINLIWFGHIARLSYWGGGSNFLIQIISICGGGRGSVRSLCVKNPLNDNMTKIRRFVPDQCTARRLKDFCKEGIITIY
jgi:hypothetical protein